MAATVYVKATNNSIDTIHIPQAASIEQVNVNQDLILVRNANKLTVAVFARENVIGVVLD